MRFEMRCKERGPGKSKERSRCVENLVVRSTRRHLSIIGTDGTLLADELEAQVTRESLDKKWNGGASSIMTETSVRYHSVSIKEPYGQ